MKPIFQSSEHLRVLRDMASDRNATLKRRETKAEQTGREVVKRRRMVGSKQKRQKRKSCARGRPSNVEKDPLSDSDTLYSLTDQSESDSDSISEEHGDQDEHEENTKRKSN